MRISTILVALLLTVAATGCGESGSGTTPSATTSTPHPVDLTSAPTDIRWDSYRGMRLPRSALDGPRRVETTLAAGYSRSPQGAVLAAMRGQAYLALAGDNEWGRVVAELTAPGPGRDEFAAYRTPLSITGSVPEDSTKFVGFRITSYRPDPLTAGVEVAVEVGTPSKLFAWPVALQWLDDDWRIVLPTTAEGIDGTELDGLDSYTLLEHS